MTIRHLDKLFNPTSVALIGASGRAGSVGQVIMKNLLSGGFDGPIMPVNPKQQSVCGVLCYPDVASLPATPDLAVVCTPPDTVPNIITDLAERGTRAAVVLTAGLGETVTPNGTTAMKELLDHTASSGMRILGPNCVGLQVPRIGLNASFAHVAATPGKIGFLSQSGALCTVVLDWAAERGIGFSHVVSLGNAMDLDFGDAIDYLATDADTRAILIYIESIRERRDFMSAARAAARNKPLLVIKSGRSEDGAKAATSHTGALAGSDDVYDAAIRRASMLRVFGISELFAAVETLAHARPLTGDRLAIMTNGGGLGVMAVDELNQQGGRLAELSEETKAALSEVLPATWSNGNPVDIIGDAPGSRYIEALNVLTEAPEVDAVLVMHAPVAVADPAEAADAVIKASRQTSKNILTSWVGEHAVARARRHLSDAGVPTYQTPGLAVSAFLHMVRYRKNQDQLMETPPSIPTGFVPTPETARQIVKEALQNGTSVLNEIDSKRILKAYGIPVVETRQAGTPEEAAIVASEIGFPVALKILSPDITHKTDLGGVRLNVDSAEGIRDAAEAMLTTIAERAPDARLTGFTVQQMAPWRRSRELIAGIMTDPIFGPVILFGEGGTAVEVIGDRAIALPPLNMSLAKELISRTRVAKLLEAYRDHPPADMDALCMVLVQLSQLVVDVPEITELDINPIFADETGVLAVDARIVVEEWAGGKHSHLAIHPYPKELEEVITLGDHGDVLLRPIRPEDEEHHYAFIAALSPEDIRFRFFGLIGRLNHMEMARFTQIDYGREMAFIATTLGSNGDSETLGVVRAAFDANRETAEFAIVVRSDMKGLGLGSKLLDKMIGYCRQRQARQLVGQVMAENARMLHLVRDLGFQVDLVKDEPGVYRIALQLN